MSKCKHYDWSDLQNPPTIDPHSIAKHNIINQYIERYLEVKCSKIFIDEFRVTIVDGFSGGGYYRDPEISSNILHGSPVHLIRTIQAAEAKLQQLRIKPFKIHADYIFVEKERHAVNALRYYLNELENIPHDNIQIIHDEFSNALPSIFKYIRRPRSKAPNSLFILDQFGYKDAPPQLIRQIFTLFPSNSETILTYQTDSLINHLSESPSFIANMERNELLEFFERVKSHRAGDCKESRLFIEQELYKELALKTGARFFTPFFITARPSNQTYWLIHLSNHPKARNVMTDVHWSNKNNSVHYGGSGINMMIGFDPKKDYGSQDYFEFIFDDDFESRNLENLCLGIPNLLSDKPITFGDLLSSTCNTSPATIDHYKQAVFQLYQEKEILLNTINGGTRHRWESVDTTDLILRNNQFRWKF